MSAAQIILELPKLTLPERLLIRRKLTELAEEIDDVALCDAIALEGAMMLDEMGAKDQANGR
jgi:hypothetical protein